MKKFFISCIANLFIVFGASKSIASNGKDVDTYEYCLNNPIVNDIEVLNWQEISDLAENSELNRVEWLDEQYDEQYGENLTNLTAQQEECGLDQNSNGVLEVEDNQDRDSRSQTDTSMPYYQTSLYEEKEYMYARKRCLDALGIVDFISYNALANDTQVMTRLGCCECQELIEKCLLIEDFFRYALRYYQRLCGSDKEVGLIEFSNNLGNLSGEIELVNTSGTSGQSPFLHTLHNIVVEIFCGINYINLLLNVRNQKIIVMERAINSLEEEVSEVNKIIDICEKILNSGAALSHSATSDIRKRIYDFWYRGRSGYGAPSADDMVIQPEILELFKQDRESLNKAIAAMHQKERAIFCDESLKTAENYYDFVDGGTISVGEIVSGWLASNEPNGGAKSLRASITMGMVLRIERYMLIEYGLYKNQSPLNANEILRRPKQNADYISNLYMASNVAHSKVLASSCQCGNADEVKMKVLERYRYIEEYLERLLIYVEKVIGFDEECLGLRDLSIFLKHLDSHSMRLLRGSCGAALSRALCDILVALRDLIDINSYMTKLGISPSLEYSSKLLLDYSHTPKPLTNGQILECCRWFTRCAKGR